MDKSVGPVIAPLLRETPLKSMQVISLLGAASSGHRNRRQKEAINGRQFILQKKQFYGSIHD
jgi:hypothetical protein